MPLCRIKKDKSGPLIIVQIYKIKPTYFPHSDASPVAWIKNLKLNDSLYFRLTQVNFLSFLLLRKISILDKVTTRIWLAESQHEVPARNHAP